jgi:plastocyanin
MTTRFATPLLVLSCLALAPLTGCGGSDSSSGGGGSGGGSAAKKGPAADKTVDMKNIQFVPKAVTISKGQTIEWKNADSVTHNVTEQKGPGGKKFASPNVNGGQTFKHTFAKPGTYDYVCTIHPNQAGTVTVR